MTTLPTHDEPTHWLTNQPSDGAGLAGLFFMCLLISPLLQDILYSIPFHVLEKPVELYTYQDLDCIPDIKVIGVEKNMTILPLSPTLGCR